MLTRGVRLILYCSSFPFLILLLLQSWCYQTIHRSVSLRIAVKNSNIYYLPKENLLSQLNPSVGRELLPPLTVENVQQFLFFVGYVHSGHGILANLLDSHPNIVIAQEYSLFSKWTKKPWIHSDKKWLFNTLLENSRHNLSQNSRTWNSKIARGWRGQYKKHIHVIGDKASGMATQMYRRNHTLFVHIYRELQRTLNIPIHGIHIILNPYDNIATMLLYSMRKKQSVNIIDRNKNDLGLKQQIISYFKQVRSVVNMIKKVPLKVIEVHTEDMISDPKKTMRRICSHLHVECTSVYLQICANSVYSLELRSRELVHWSEENIQLVQDNIQNFVFLKRYDFLN